MKCGESFGLTQHVDKKQLKEKDKGRKQIGQDQLWLQ